MCFRSRAIDPSYTNAIKILKGKKHTCLIFLDIKKAFNTVNHQILLQKLRHYGVRGIANDLIKSYLQNRF